MLFKIGGRPTDIGGVAHLAISREIPGFVVRTARCIKVVFMAGETIRWGVREIAPGVTLRAILNVMAFGQRKKQVIPAAGLPKPIGTGYVVADKTIRRITGRLVVGGRGGCIIILVAINALVAKAIKTQRGFRMVAGVALRDGVLPQQGKPVLLVYLRDVVDQPVIGIVTTRTIGAYRLLVYVGVTGNAVRTNFRKRQRLVATRTIHGGMPTRQVKPGLAVLKPPRL